MPPQRRTSRASWTGLRTLRLVPTVVGRTDAGETIYQAGTARLVLRSGAARFNRLVDCSKCGREVPGLAVLSPGELEQPARPVVCDDCVEAATALAAPADAQRPPDQGELRRRLDQMVDRLEQLQQTIDAETARATSEAATIAQAMDGLNERVDEVAAGLARALETQGKELQDGRDEIAELQELQAVLDTGLGALRGELAELRATLSRSARGGAKKA